MNAANDPINLKVNASAQRVSKRTSSSLQAPKAPPSAWPSGWWLLPSILMGAIVWFFILTFVIGFFLR